MLTNPTHHRAGTQEIFNRATSAYTERCHHQGLAPLTTSVFKSLVSERFVELRTESNLKLGVFFPSADEFLCYDPYPPPGHG
ncbi:MAG: hypothetical protein U1F76_07815 [Candidatus Competibacteraceae bacterium]